MSRLDKVEEIWLVKDKLKNFKLSRIFSAFNDHLLPLNISNFNLPSQISKVKYDKLATTFHFESFIRDMKAKCSLFLYQLEIWS